MDISPLLRRGISIAAIFCFLESDAPAQTAAGKASVAQSGNAASERPAGAEQARLPNGSGPYTTMCVRSCDGFYFPVRQNARPEDFMRDARICSSDCGSEVRLFYFPFYGGTPATMIDLAGRKYIDEPNAFAFRKAIIPRCACKPAPWSKEAAWQHQRYEAEEEARRAEQAAAEARKTSAAISAAAAREYYESDARAQGRVP